MARGGRGPDPRRRSSATGPRRGTEPDRSARAGSWLWRHRRVLFGLALLALTGVAGAAYLVARLPLPPTTPVAQTTFVTDASGQLLATFEANGQNRVSVPLSQVPKSLIQAVVATEDRHFFTEGPLSPTGILRAAWADLTGGSLQGGSTITQQYVKNAYLTDQRTLVRKLEEAVLAIKVSHVLSKDQILSRYLNTIYFGRGAYGVEAAAKAYFGIDVSHVDLDEAAYLASLIRSPETADATLVPAAARARRDLTLASMVRAGYLSRAAAARAAAVPVGGPGGYVIAPVSLQPRIQARDGTQYFVAYVRQQLIHRYGEAEVDGGGLRVRTSLDLTAQAQAYHAVYGLLGPGDPAGALVAVDDTGAVRAMVGGRNYASSQVNLAVGRAGGGSGRQSGSTFKAFLLSATVAQGYSVESAFPAPPSITIPDRGGKPYTVTNFESESFSHPIGLVRATADSVNTVYAQLEERIGTAKMVAMAHAMGITSPLPAGDPSLVLGTADVSVLEMAGAYSTLANGGVRVTPRSVLSVRAPDGRVLQPDQVHSHRVLTPAQAALVDYCLEQVVAHGSGQGAAIGRPVAGKTGTTEHYDDAWFVGFTPTLTTAVWMGYPDSESHHMSYFRGIPVTGGSFPAEIFHRFMAAATAGQPVADFPPPPPLYQGRALTGLLRAYSPGTGPGGAGAGSSTSSTPATATGSSTTTTVVSPTTTAPAGPAGGTTTTTAPGGGPSRPPPTTTTSAPPRPTTTTAPPSTTTSAPPRPTTTTAPPSTTTTPPRSTAPKAAPGGG